MLSGCLVDTDKPCSANQVQLEGEIAGCICAPDSVPNANGAGCTKCGEHSTVVNGACACDAGYAQVTAGGACVQSLLGAACSATLPCGPSFPLCTPAGYCTTSGCSSTQPCVGGYTCDTSTTPAFCRKPATGQGMTCTTMTECASFDAKFCALSGPMGSCAVSGCKTGAARCDTGYSCCDFTAFGLADICLTSAALVNGKCPGTMADPVVAP